MIMEGAYDYVCRTPAEVPTAAYAWLRPELGALLGHSVSIMLPEFHRAFPLTVSAMEAVWSRPIVCLNYSPRHNDWLASLVLEAPARNLFFDLRPRNFGLEGSWYDADHAMLPPRWRELYRAFESFVITDQSIKPMGWKNTPFNYSSRLDLEEFRRAVGATKAQARALRDAIGSDRLMCWMLTDRGDALLLDEAHNDHKVYHVFGRALENVTELRDASEILDRYLAGVVASDPQTFNFDLKVGY